VLWVDSCLSVIRATDYHGTTVHTLYTWDQRIDFPYVLAVFENHLYWTTPNAWTHGHNGISVLECKITDKTCRTVKTSPNLIYSLAIMHPLKQLQKENPCSTLHCAHMCLLSPSGVSCVQKAVAAESTEMSAGTAAGIAFLVIIIFLGFLAVSFWYIKFRKPNYVKGFNIKFSRNPRWGILRSDTTASTSPAAPPAPVKPPKRRTISYSNPSYEEYIDANSNIQKSGCMEIDAFQCKVSMEDEKLDSGSPENYHHDSNMRTRLI